MQIVIDIPDEQIEKSLEESKYIHENEGEKGSVNIVLLYTNKKLEFVDISRKADFYSLTDKYAVLPKGHGRLIDADEAIKTLKSLGNRDYRREKGTIQDAVKMLNFDEYTPTIIEADKEQEE